MNIIISAISDVGIERTDNEDAIIVCPDLNKQNWTDDCPDDALPLGEHGAMLVVADGMGGANAGEVASSIAIQTVREYFSKERLDGVSVTRETALALLREAIILSDKAIMQHVATDPDSIGLGTTIVIAWIVEDKAFIAWCGDSRCYAFNPNDGLRQLTKDHSYVQKLVDSGEISSKQAFNHPDSNIITQYLGDDSCEPDTAVCDVKDGSVLLLCSDGLCGYCRDSLIENTMCRSVGNLRMCRDELLKIAMDAGGHDNISIALCSISSDNAVTSVGLMEKIKRLFSKF